MDRFIEPLDKMFIMSVSENNKGKTHQFFFLQLPRAKICNLVKVLLFLRPKGTMQF